MADQYKITDIFTFEEITRHYCVNKGSTELNAKTLINLGLLAGNDDYAEYIVYKHGIQLEELINKKINKIGLTFSKDVVNDPDHFLEYKGNFYKELYNHHKSQVNKDSDIPKIEHIIDLVIADGKHIDILYFIFFREEEKIRHYLARREDEINTTKRESVKDRKFFILQ